MILALFVSFLWFNPLAMGAVTLPFNDGFESYSGGTSPPSPWTNLSGGPGTVTTTKAHGGSKSLVVSGGPYASQSSVVDLGTSYTDFLQYEGWVNNDGGHGIFGFHEQVSNMAPSFNAVRLQTNRDVYFISADGATGFNVLLMSGLSSGWHYVKVQLNFQAGVGNIWLDGVLIGNNLSISPKNVTYGGSPTTLRHIGIIHHVDSPVYLDDFCVSYCSSPGSFSYLSPLNGATGQARDVDLDWGDASGATSYDVYFGTTNPPPFSVNKATSSHDPGTLNYITTYYWKIVAKNICGSTASPVWSFTTAPCPTPGTPSGDGKTDVLWRNTSTGQNVVWLMDGVNYGGYAWLLEVADLNWEIVGTGDFNGDGKTDILWRNKGTGQNVVWFMDGATYSSYAELMQVADANWEIVGTGDFNGDGKIDILWRNKSTGQNVVWYMNGAVYSSYAELMQVTDTNWQIVGTGDFNNDGKVDILWRNKSTGQNEVWFMNGAAFSSYSLIDTVADTNWEIVGPK